VFPFVSDHFDDGELPHCWTPNRGTWSLRGGHMRGAYDEGHAWNIHSSTGVNFVYSGRVRLSRGSAAGLVFRSSPDGTSSYDVILDTAHHAFKVARRSPYEVLGSVPMVVHRNQDYRIQVVVRGDLIEAYLDGNLLVSVTDATYAAGQLGVVLFQAAATYDDLEAWHLP
jgi:levanase